MTEDIKQAASKLFIQTFADKIIEIEKLPISGSARSYYRITGEKYTAVLTYNIDIKENEAFIYLSEHFRSKGINVPEVFAVNIDKTIYLQEDLGDETLFDRTNKLRQEDIFPDEILNFYKKALEQLAEIQTEGAKDLDFSYCYPREAFDEQSMTWDLNYFKYNFLKLTGISFDEQLLENDFNNLISYLLNTDTNYFLYRDFKSLNIMVKDDELYFIDFQGGRKGALAYDVASVLHEASANIPGEIKQLLLNHYINQIDSKLKINKEKFSDLFHAYSLIRVLQAMGTYGFRGLFEKKQHYIDSIPKRLDSLEGIIQNVKILEDLPELKRILNELPKINILRTVKEKDKLTVSIKSFSYKKGIPIDTTGNGGGFVFDCRFLNNPGRIDKYKKLCGKDKEVIDFLEAEEDVKYFFDSVKQISKNSISNYLSRGFKHLSVNFGCTGGQHRSVYMAEKISAFISTNFDVYVNKKHTEGF